MGFTRLGPVPEVEELKERYKLTEDEIRIRSQLIEEMKGILRGEINKLIWIFGPCCADDENAIYEINDKTKDLQNEVSDHIMLIRRIYTLKPRTKGIGYKGPANKKNGLDLVRRMHVNSFKQSHLLSADEVLNWDNWPYIDDTVGWVAGGARSAENQRYWEELSRYDIPVGLKHNRAGELDILVNAIECTQDSHIIRLHFKDGEHEKKEYYIRTDGNPYAHGILRGKNIDSVDKPNYHFEDLKRVIDLMTSSNIKNPGFIVDTNHSNSNKNPGFQYRIAMEVMRSKRELGEKGQQIRGFMSEVHLKYGNQPPTGTEYGKSKLDACLDFESGRRMVLDVAKFKDKHGL